MIAASAYAAISGRKVAGLFDHTANEQLRIAVECRGTSLQGADAERSARFFGTLPEIFDEGDQSYVSLDIEGTRASGYDRGTQGHYSAEVSGRLIQLYDHGEAAWFAYEVLEFPGSGA